MKTKFYLFTLLLCCFCSIGQAWGEDVTLTTADYTWSASNKHVAQTVSGITFDFNGGTTYPTYYSSDGLRTYEGCVITISSSSNITGIAFTYTVSNSGSLSTETGTWTSSTKKWSGSATSIPFTVGHSSGTKNGQVKITKIVVSAAASTKTVVY